MNEALKECSKEYLIKQLEYSYEEIERLNKENELLKSNPNFVYAIRNNKAIEYIEKHIVATETENILLDILKGEDNDN